MNYRYWRFICICALFSLNAFYLPVTSAPIANIDSVYNIVIDSKNDTVKVNALNKLGQSYIDLQQKDKALSCFTKAKVLAQFLNFQVGLAQSFSGIGIIYSGYGDFNKSLYNSISLLKIAQKLNHNYFQAQALLNIGTEYFNQGYYFEALKYFYQSLGIAEKHRLPRVEAMCLNNIGLIFISQKKYNQALESFNRSLKIKKAIHDTNSLTVTLGNIAIVYIETSNYTKALQNEFMSLVYAKKNKKIDEIGDVYSSLGSIYMLQKKNDSAIVYLSKAINIYKEAGIKRSLTFTYIKLSNVYYAQKKIAQAQLYAQKGFELANKTGSLEDLADTYKTLSIIDSSLKKYQSALKNYQIYITYRDSILNRDNSNNMAQAHMKYDFDKKLVADSIRFVANAKVTQAQLKQEKTYRYALYFGLVLVLLVAVFIYNRFKVTQKQQAIIAEQGKKEILALEQKFLRSQMNPHFIFNAVNTIDGFIFKNRNAEASIYLKRFAGLTRQILEYSEREYILLNEELSVLENYIELQKIMFDNCFNYEINIDDLLDKEEILIPPMLAQPFVENAIKYGMTNKDAPGNIKVSFTKKNEFVVLTIEDDGPGLGSNANDGNHKSMSTSIVKRRLANYTNNNKLNVFIKNKIDNLGNVIGTIVSIDVPYLID